MSIPHESIQVGQCYLTRFGVVRRVRAISSGRVLYETRGRTNPKNPGWSWYPGIVDIKVFASLTERSVPYDWTPETQDPGKPRSG